MSNLTSQRLTQQLNTLATTVRACLEQDEALVTQAVEIKPIYSSNIHGADQIENAITIRLSADTEHHELVLYPVHAGSQTEVSVGVLGPGESVGNQDPADDADAVKPIESIATFHSRFNPLPAGCPSEFLDARHRVVIQILKNHTDTDLAAITSALENIRASNTSELTTNNTSVLLFSLDESLMTSARQICLSMKSDGGWQAHSFLVETLTHYHSLHGNATLALHATEPDCADALVAGVPCVIWGSESPGKSLYSLSDIRFPNTPLHGQSVIKYRTELYSVLRNWLSVASDKPVTYESRTIISPAIDDKQQARLTTRASRKLDQGKRKIRKFRESPSRFVNDSQSPLLRPFKNKRLSL